MSRLQSQAAAGRLPDLPVDGRAAVAIGLATVGILFVAARASTAGFVILAVLFTSTDTVRSDNRVERVEPGQPAAGKLQSGDRIIAVDGKRGDLVRLSEQIAHHRCPGRQTDGCGL